MDDSARHNEPRDVRDATGDESKPRVKFGLSISVKIPLVVGLLAAFACVTLVNENYQAAVEEIDRATKSRLVALRDARRTAVVDYLASIRRDLRLQSASPYMVEAFRTFDAAWRELGPDAAERLRREYIEENPFPPAGRKQMERAAAQSAYSEAHARFHPRLREYAEVNGYRDLFILGAEGRVLYSVMKRNDFAMALNEGGDPGEGLGDAYRFVMADSSAASESFVDFRQYSPADGRPTAFFARPVTDDMGVRIGVLVFEMPVERFDRIVNIDAGLGETGNIVIVGDDGMTRNNSRLGPSLTRYDAPGLYTFKFMAMGRAEIGQREAHGDRPGMIWTFAPVNFVGTNWSVIAQVELSEVHAPADWLWKVSLERAIVLSLAIAFLSWLFTILIVGRPLRRLAMPLAPEDKAEPEDAMPYFSRGDEIGGVARALARQRIDHAEHDRLASQHEEEVKAEEVRRRLAEAIEAISEGFILLDPDDRIVLVNSRYCETYQQSAHLLTPGADFAAFLRHHAELGEIVEAQGRVDEFMADRMDRMQPGDTIESRMANGRWLLISDYATEDGGTVSVCADITDLKRREHALVDSEERYRLLVDTLPDGVMLHDIERIQFMNAVGREILGIPEDQRIEDLHYRNFVHESERAAAEDRIRMITVDGIENSLAERRVRSLDGKEKVIEIAAVPFRRGGVNFGLAVFRDITDRKMTELRLRESESQVRAIVDTAADAIVMLDENDGIVDFNPAAQQIFGYRRDEMIGKQMAAALVAPTHRADHKGILREVAADGAGAHRREIEGMRNDGEIFPAELTVTQVAVEGRLLFAAFLRDLTEAKQAQAEIERQREALHQSEKLTALGSLLAGVAHELNNPLSVVVAQTVLMEETARDDRIIKRAKEIRSAAERCARIVKTFLSMARQQKPEQGVVRLNDLIGNGLELLGYSLRTAGIEVVKELDADLPNVWGDADQLHQVVANLIVNAQQAMMDEPEPRKLTVTSEFDKKKGLVVVNFDDTGPGVPEDLRMRIFDPFYTTKPTGIGTGIGLSVCHGVIESHGGRILVEEASGGGARFRLELPSTAGIHGEDKTEAPSAVAPLPNGHRILVVDDEPEIASALAEILTLDGHSVDTADSGESALERIANAEYDLILTDLRMPKLDGQGLYERLKVEKPHLCKRIAVITGDTLHAAASDFLQKSGLPMLEKPFIPSDVSRLVSEMLEHAGAK